MRSKIVEKSVVSLVVLFATGGFVLLTTSGCVVSTYGGPSTEPEIPLAPERAQAEKESGGSEPQAGPTQVGASHILVSYKGAMRAAPYIQRTKEEALALAQEIRGKAAAGQDFGALAKEFSDDPGSAANDGSLGVFTRAQMVKEFSEAAFALEIGAISQVVESPFGFHVILRTE
jgi:parvulin-like peptidyl-prolyl isomerase